MITYLKIIGIVIVAFVAGAFVASPELRAYAANTVGSADIINNSIQSIDIKDGEIKTADLGQASVTNGKIKDGEVRTQEIRDGTIKLADISTSAIKLGQRDDCNCGGSGWDPDGQFTYEYVYDSTVTPDSVVSVSIIPPTFTGFSCSAANENFGYFVVQCSNFIPNGLGINYAVLNP